MCVCVCVSVCIYIYIYMCVCVYVCVCVCMKKKNLFLFDQYFKTIHTYTLSMSYINNQSNKKKKIIANMVIMRAINDTTWRQETPLKPG